MLILRNDWFLTSCNIIYRYCQWFLFPSFPANGCLFIRTPKISNSWGRQWGFAVERYFQLHQLVLLSNPFSYFFQFTNTFALWQRIIVVFLFIDVNDICQWCDSVLDVGEENCASVWNFSYDVTAGEQPWMLGHSDGQWEHRKGSPIFVTRWTCKNVILQCHFRNYGTFYTKITAVEQSFCFLCSKHMPMVMISATVYNIVVVECNVWSQKYFTSISQKFQGSEVSTLSNVRQRFVWLNSICV